MRELVSGNLEIEEKKLNQGFYFQCLLEEAIIKKLITPEQTERVQYGILELMTKEVERFTNGESSSVVIEQAQELLQSITYIIGLHLKQESTMAVKLELLTKETMSLLFYRGLDEVELLYKRAQRRLKELQNKGGEVLNIAYRDTLYQGLPEFFHAYNMEFGAHQLQGCIDYPLLLPVTEYLGIEMIDRYLHNLSIEERITGRFSMERINHLLLSFDRDAQHLLINICELVLINSLACVLLKKEVMRLALTGDELDELQGILTGLNMEEMECLVERALSELVELLSLSTEEEEYLLSARKEQTQRLWNNCRLATLEHYFIITDSREEEIHEFIDGESMEDERLRELIQELNQLPSIEEKALLLRNKVRSTADLILILEDCFNPEEYLELYRQLGEEELWILRHSLKLEAGRLPMEAYEPREEWQKQLLLL